MQIKVQDRFNQLTNLTAHLVDFSFYCRNTDLALHPNGRLRDGNRMVAHPLQITGCLQDSDDCTKVARYRLLQGNDFQRFLFQFQFEFIDFGIRFNDFLGQFPVMGDEGPDCLVDLSKNLISHSIELVMQFV